LLTAAILVVGGVVTFTVGRPDKHETAVAARPSSLLAAPATVPTPDTVTGPPTEIAAPVALSPDLFAGGELAPVVDEATARQALRALWTVRETAMLTRDVATVNAVETGAARSWDLGKILCGCAHDRLTLLPFPEETTLFVPRHDAFPAFFIAQIPTQSITIVNGSMIEVMVVTRQSAAEPWKLAVDTGYGAAPDGLLRVDAPRLGPDGFDEPVSPWVSADGAARALASYYQSWEETGGAPYPTAIVDGTFASEVGLERADHVDWLPLGLDDTARATWHADAQPPYLVGLVTGQDYACTSLTRTIEVDLSQFDERRLQDPARQRWGPLLEPGVYRHVTITEAWQSCLVLSPAGGSPFVGVVGSNGGTVAIVGVPA
jgi:hypothetical protein